MRYLVRNLVRCAHLVCSYSVLAVDGANERAGILHRDISYRNIMLDSDGRGVLNDWDHASSDREKANGIVGTVFPSHFVVLMEPVRAGHMGVHVDPTAHRLGADSRAGGRS